MQQRCELRKAASTLVPGTFGRFKSSRTSPGANALAPDSTAASSCIAASPSVNGTGPTRKVCGQAISRSPTVVVRRASHRPNGKPLLSAGTVNGTPDGSVDSTFTIISGITLGATDNGSNYNFINYVIPAA